MKFDVLKKFAALLSVICVSFASVGCAPAADEAPAGGEAAAEETEGGDEGGEEAAEEEAGTEGEGASATE